MIPPVTFMKKLKEYQGLVNEYNTLLRIFKEKKELLADLKDELEIMQNGIFSAKVINRGTWVELNEIRFVILHKMSPTSQNKMKPLMSSR